MDESMNDVSPSVSRDSVSEGRAERLGSTELRRLIEGMVRRKVPESEVEDLVQTVLVDALASDGVPDDDESLRRWVAGITRHKVADYHRRGKRGKQVELPEQLAGDEPPISAREWARWATDQAADDPEAQRTLDWMAREGGGEKLAHIAADEKVPAPQVRQRVSRLRRWMKERWAAELAAVAAVVLLALIAWRLLREPPPTAVPVPQPVPEVVPGPVDRRVEEGRRLRADALMACDQQAWERCLEGLDEAAALDPAGDEDAAVGGARQRASEALDQQQEQSKGKTKGDVKSAPPPSATTSAAPPQSTSPKNQKPPPNPNNPLPEKTATPPVKKPNKGSLFGPDDGDLKDGEPLQKNNAPPDPPPQQQQTSNSQQPAYPEKPSPKTNEDSVGPSSMPQQRQMKKRKK